MNAICSLSASILSGVLLVLAFPRYDLGSVVWVALVPLLLALEGKNWRYGFLLSHFCGIGFIVGTFRWILEVPNYAPLHHGLLVVYFGAYLGLFGLGFCLISRRWGTIPALFTAPFLWVSLEYCKSNLSFLALPWALLAHSQYRFTPIIQIASIAGAYGVSFLIVVVNSAIAALLYHLMRTSNKHDTTPSLVPAKGRTMALAVTAAVLTTAALIYGRMTLSRPLSGREFRVSVVQGNIEQTKKWDQAFAEFIMQTYADLTSDAAKDQPALIVWPETATPRAIDQDFRLRADLRRIAREASAYLLVGSSQQRKFKNEGPHKLKYVNSAFLISPGPGQERNQRYDKMRLLPFGEYLPLKGVVPWSYLKVPEVTTYASGAEFTVFRIPEIQFGVTICWENIFPDVVRQFVTGGAQFIVNITNEAWFGESAAPYQFVSMSVFRAVENRVYVVRCTNTGVSCFIDPYGRVTKRLMDWNGQDIFIRGVLTGSIVLMESATFYTRYGDWLVWSSVLFSVVFPVVALVRKNPSMPATPETKD